MNDAKIIRPRELGGFGMDAQWCDDFHHSLRTLVTGEKKGYYIDFGKTEQFAKAWREGFVYSGQYSQYRKRRHGNSSKERPARQFVVFAQNHDQVGNRMPGERLPALVSFEALKLAAGVIILSPCIPMLFMGEEYGEEAPFLYFVNHSDPNLIEAVRKGRKEEFKSFNSIGEPPDPQSVDTFLKSKLDWEKRAPGEHSVLLDYYKNLIKLRKDNAWQRIKNSATQFRGFQETENWAVIPQWPQVVKVANNVLSNPPKSQRWCNSHSTFTNHHIPIQKMRIPISTYRLQFTPVFGFKEARDIVAYLDALGISDIYASPIFKAKAGGTHGYDISWAAFMRSVWKTARFNCNTTKPDSASTIIPCDSLARIMENIWAVTMAPRFLAGVVKAGEYQLGKQVWVDTHVVIPEEAPVVWNNSLISQSILGEKGLWLADVFQHFPVALLLGEKRV